MSEVTPGGKPVPAPPIRSPDGRAAFLLAVAAAALLVVHFEASEAGLGRWFLDTSRRPEYAMTSFAMSFLVLGVLPMFLADGLCGLRPRDLGLRTGDPRAGLLLLSWAVPLAILLAWLSSRDPAFRRFYPLGGPHIGEATGGLLRYHGLYGLFYLGYEFLFRGLLLFGLRERFGDAGANMAQTALAALFHLGRPEAEAFAALASGPLFGWAALRTGSFLYGWVAHAALGIGLDLFLLARGGA